MTNQGNLPVEFIKDATKISEPGRYLWEQSPPTIAVGQALVIAHAHYGKQDILEEAVKEDMKRMTSLLHRYGYTVTIWYEQTSSDLPGLWGNWIKEHAKPAATWFIYFSGHGSSRETRNSKKDYVFLAGLNNQRPSEFIPFSVENFQKPLSLDPESDKEVTRVGSCIICIDTCTGEFLGRSMSQEESIAEALLHIREKHQIVSILFNDKAEKSKTDAFSRKFESEIRMAIRSITLRNDYRENGQRTHLYIRHNDILNELIINGVSFFNKDLFAPRESVAFKINVLLFAKELLKEEPNEKTVVWIKKYVPHLGDITEIEGRKWAWISYLISTGGHKKLLAQVEELDQMIGPEKLRTAEEIGRECDSLRRLCHIPEEYEEYWNHIRNHYQLSGALARIHNYTGSDSSEVAHIEADIKIIREIILFYDSFTKAYQKLLRSGEWSDCHQLISFACKLPFDELDRSEYNLYTDVADIIEKYDPRKFFDNIKLLRILGTRLRNSSKEVEVAPPKRKQRILDILCRKPLFWFLGVVLYAILLLCIAPIIEVTRSKDWALQFLILFAYFYLSFRVVFFFFQHVWSRLKRWEWEWEWEDLSFSVPLSVSLLISVAVAIMTNQIMAVHNLVVSIFIGFIFVVIGIVIGLVGLQEYKSNDN